MEKQDNCLKFVKIELRMSYMLFDPYSTEDALRPHIRNNISQEYKNL